MSRSSLFSFQALRFFAKRLGKDSRGMAAVEFALILPLMLMVYLGLVEVSRGMRAAQKVDLVAHTMADLTAQMLPGQSTKTDAPCTSSGQACMTNADMTKIFSAAQTLLSPFPLNNIKMTISEAQITGVPNNTTPTSWKAKLQWTAVKNGATKRPCSAQMDPLNAAPVAVNAIPVNYVTNLGVPPAVPNSIIIADVIYEYSPGVNFQMFKWSSPPTWTMKRTSYAQVRNTYNPNHILYYMTAAGDASNCNGTTP